MSPLGAARAIAIPAAVALAGCAVHPAGESEERERAEAAGTAYEAPAAERAVPPLDPRAPWEDVLRHALLSNAGLEARYWEWRAAIERIPQEASPKTTGALFFEHILSGGSALERTALAIGNDPMFNIPWPGKLAAAGRRALEEARAAGLRFDRAKLDLQKDVITAYVEWALLAEMVRVQETNVMLLSAVAAAADGRAQAGGAQDEALRARTREDLARNDLDALRSRVPGERARLNALLSRLPGAPLEPPRSLPPPRPFSMDESEALALASSRNPELRALERDEAGGSEAVRLARLDYVPEFGASAGTDLAGTAQSLAGMVTAPFLRFEAIEAGIAEAQARLRWMEAVRRKAQTDAIAELVVTLRAMKDAERQAALFRGVIVPRAEQAVTAMRASYAAGRLPILDVLDGQRTLNEVRLMLVRLQAEREKLLAAAESIAGVELSGRAGAIGESRPGEVHEGR